MMLQGLRVDKPNNAFMESLMQRNFCFHKLPMITNSQWYNFMSSWHRWLKFDLSPASLFLKMNSQGLQALADLDVYLIMSIQWC